MHGWAVRHAYGQFHNSQKFSPLWRFFVADFCLCGRLRLRVRSSGPAPSRMRTFVIGEQHMRGSIFCRHRGLFHLWPISALSATESSSVATDDLLFVDNSIIEGRESLFVGHGQSPDGDFVDFSRSFRTLFLQVKFIVLMNRLGNVGIWVSSSRSGGIFKDVVVDIWGRFGVCAVGKIDLPIDSITEHCEFVRGVNIIIFVDAGACVWGRVVFKLFGNVRNSGLVSVSSNVGSKFVIIRRIASLQTTLK